ncbi:MAG: NAD(P)H-hydrate epimerase [Candidatus Brocadiia bacterium]
MPEEIRLSCEQSRQVDSIAAQKYGIPGLVLMENAGLRCADIILGILSEFPEPRSATIITGKGNNGGDGYVIARHLHNRGIAVRVFGVSVKAFQFEGAFDKSVIADLGRRKKQQAAERFGIERPAPPEDDARTNLRIISRMGIPLFEIGTDVSPSQLRHCLKETDVVVDALMGTGSIGIPRSPYDETIRAINSCGKKVVSVDLPSGLDANTGIAAGECVKADFTVTFVAQKTGFALNDGPKFCGQVIVAEISLPKELVEGLARKVER